MFSVVSARVAPALFVLVSIPLLCASALEAPAGLEWAAAAFGLLALWRLGRPHPAVAREAWVVVVFGLLVELTLAAWLGWYEYAQWPVPPWVPVGHGLLWLAARTVPLAALDERRGLVVMVLAAAQLGWMMGHQRLDAVGLIFLAVLVYAVISRAKPAGFVFGLAALVWWLEIWGASVFGVWAWQPSVLGVPEISPPGSAAGGYLLLLEAPGLALAAWLGRSRSRLRSGK